MADATPLYAALKAIHARPAPFSCSTTRELWTDDYVSAQMLACHLEPSNDLASRRHAFIDRSVAWMAETLAVGDGTRVLDLGCGPGLYTTRLARLGAQVTGVDFSARSLAYARETAAAEGLSIAYIASDYLEFATDARFDLITMIYCDFCVLSPARRAQLLDRVHDLLAPGSVFLFDACTTAGYAQRVEGATWSHSPSDGFWSAESCFELHETFRYDAERVVLDKYTLVERERTRTIYNWLQYLQPAELVEELERQGFVVEGLYGDVAGSPPDLEAPEMGIVARRA